MIVRSWRGFASHNNADAYVQHPREDFFPVLDNIRRFAGNEPETAVVAPAAQALLSRWDERVHHYRVIGSGGQ